MTKKQMAALAAAAGPGPGVRTEAKNIPSAGANCVVAFVHYRTSDTAPFPAPFEDCYTALRWVWDNAPRLRLIRTSNQKVFLILDNLKVHHGKKTAAWLDRRQDKIELFFLPPYAPESNPDEYLNHALKLSVHSGSLPQTKRDIRHKTASFMRPLQHCPDKVSAFFQHSQISYVLIRE